MNCVYLSWISISARFHRSGVWNRCVSLSGQPFYFGMSESWLLCQICLVWARVCVWMPLIATAVWVRVGACWIYCCCWESELNSQVILIKKKNNNNVVELQLAMNEAKKSTKLTSEREEECQNETPINFHYACGPFDIEISPCISDCWPKKDVKNIWFFFWHVDFFSVVAVHLILSHAVFILLISFVFFFLVRKGLI